jgi:hypothetical protein
MTPATITKMAVKIYREIIHRETIPCAPGDCGSKEVR